MPQKYIVILVFLLLAVSIIFLSFKSSPIHFTDNTNKNQYKNYLALGDSYTIGQSVPYNQNFPSQLVQQLLQQSIKINEPEIIGRTGFTTNDLLQTIQNNHPLLKKYDVVTLLIGVNNQFQGLSIEQYKIEYNDLLQKAIGFAGSNKGVIVLSIPDYSVTAFAQQSNKKQIHNQINAFNIAQKQIALANNVVFIDITEISRKGKSQPNLQAYDGLHPSAEQYQLWVQAMLPSVLQVLQ